MRVSLPIQMCHYKSPHQVNPQSGVQAIPACREYTTHILPAQSSSLANKFCASTSAASDRRRCTTWLHVIEAVVVVVVTIAVGHSRAGSAHYLFALIASLIETVSRLCDPFVVFVVTAKLTCQHRKDEPNSRLWSAWQARQRLDRIQHPAGPRLLRWFTARPFVRDGGLELRCTSRRWRPLKRKL